MPDAELEQKVGAVEDRVEDIELRIVDLMLDLGKARRELRVVRNEFYVGLEQELDAISVEEEHLEKDGDVG